MQTNQQIIEDLNKRLDQAKQAWADLERYIQSLETVKCHLLDTRFSFKNLVAASEGIGKRYPVMYDQIAAALRDGPIQPRQIIAKLKLEESNEKKRLYAALSNYSKLNYVKKTPKGYVLGDHAPQSPTLEENGLTKANSKSAPQKKPGGAHRNANYRPPDTPGSSH